MFVLCVCFYLHRIFIPWYWSSRWDILMRYFMSQWVMWSNWIEKWWRAKNVEINVGFSFERKRMKGAFVVSHWNSERNCQEHTSPERKWEFLGSSVAKWRRKVNGIYRRLMRGVKNLMPRSVLTLRALWITTAALWRSVMLHQVHTQIKNN